MCRLPNLAASLFALCSLPAIVFAGPSTVAVPLDSFINQHVDSVAQMSQQVTLDPVVRRRLARHFHTSGPAVVQYIQHNLVLKKTTHAGRYRVYCISRTGREYVITARLPAGTPLFVLRSTGKPILKLACGNPMVASLPPVVKKEASLESPPKLAGLRAPTAAEISPELAANAPTVVAMSGPGDTLVPAPVTKVAGGIYTLPSGGGRFPIGYLAGIPILAGIVGSSSGGGNNGNSTGSGSGNSTGTETSTGSSTGNGTGTGTGTSTGGNTGAETGTNTGTGTGTGITPVPEPGTPVALAVGASGVALLIVAARVRRRKRTR